jgi:hypothetical protein
MIIIYLEDLANRKLTVDELRRDGALWESLTTDLRRRAIAGMQMRALRY